MYSVIDMIFCKREHRGECMCVDDSICDEFLYNKTRGSLISSCVIKTTGNSGFGENLYHFSAKNLNLEEAMAFFIGQNYSFQTLGEGKVLGRGGDKVHLTDLEEEVN